MERERGVEGRKETLIEKERDKERRRREERAKLSEKISNIE